MVKIKRFFFAFLHIALAVVISSSSSTISSVLDLQTRINKITLHGHRDLYVASTNHLYKVALDPFRVAIDLVTGPKSQKQQCAFITESTASPTQCIKYICEDTGGASSSKTDASSSKSSRLVDNDNRLLLVDEQNANLIECGTVDYGACRLRHLESLEVMGCNYSAPVIPFSSASGVVVSSSTPLNSAASTLDESSLYLMVSNEYDPAERLDKSDFPVFSIRYLASSSASSGSQLRPQYPLFQSKYPIESMNYDQSIFSPDFHMRIIFR